MIRRWKKEEDVKLLQLFRNNKTYEDLMKEFDRSNGSISMRLGKLLGFAEKKLKEPEARELLSKYDIGELQIPEKMKWTKENINKLLIKFGSGASIKELQREYNITSYCIYFKLKKYSNCLIPKASEKQIKETLLKNDYYISLTQLSNDNKQHENIIVPKEKINKNVIIKEQINIMPKENLQSNINEIKPAPKKKTKKRAIAPPQTFSQTFPQINQVTQIFPEEKKNEDLFNF
jgi:hypothetical protein